MSKSSPPQSDPYARRDGDAPYVTICVSTYPHELRKLDAMVRELKHRGLTKANRSALIRVALRQLDLDKVPRGL